MYSPTSEKLGYCADRPSDGLWWNLPLLPMPWQDVIPLSENFNLLPALECSQGKGMSPSWLGTSQCSFWVASNVSLLPPQMTSFGQASSHTEEVQLTRNWGWPLISSRLGARLLSLTACKELNPASNRCVAHRPSPGETSYDILPRSAPHCSWWGTIGHRLRLCRAWTSAPRTRWCHNFVLF